MTRLLEGHHDRWAAGVAELAQSMWLDAMEASTSPHVCPARFCDCHVSLWANQPETLPLGDEWPAGLDQPMVVQHWYPSVAPMLPDVG